MHRQAIERGLDHCLFVIDAKATRRRTAHVALLGVDQRLPDRHILLGAQLLRKEQHQLLRGGYGIAHAIAIARVGYPGRCALPGKGLWKVEARDRAICAVIGHVQATMTAHRVGDLVGAICDLCTVKHWAVWRPRPRAPVLKVPVDRDQVGHRFGRLPRAPQVAGGPGIADQRGRRQPKLAQHQVDRFRTVDHKVIARDQATGDCDDV